MCLCTYLRSGIIAPHSKYSRSLGRRWKRVGSFCREQSLVLCVCTRFRFKTSHVMDHQRKWHNEITICENRPRSIHLSFFLLSFQLWTLNAFVDPNSNQFSRTTVFACSLIFIFVSFAEYENLFSAVCTDNGTCHSHNFHSFGFDFTVDSLFFFFFCLSLCSRRILLYSLIVCLHSCLIVCRYINSEKNRIDATAIINCASCARLFYSNVLPSIHLRLHASTLCHIGRALNRHRCVDWSDCVNEIGMLLTKSASNLGHSLNGIRAKQNKIERSRKKDIGFRPFCCECKYIKTKCVNKIIVENHVASISRCLSVKQTTTRSLAQTHSDGHTYTQLPNAVKKFWFLFSFNKSLFTIRAGGRGGNGDDSRSTPCQAYRFVSIMYIYWTQFTSRLPLQPSSVASVNIRFPAFPLKICEYCYLSLLWLLLVLLQFCWNLSLFHRFRCWSTIRFIYIWFVSVFSSELFAKKRFASTHGAVCCRVIERGETEKITELFAHTLAIAHSDRYIFSFCAQ